MDTSEKLILLGIGAIIGGLLGVVGFKLRLFPAHKLKKNKRVCVASFVLGTILIILGVVMR